MADGKKRAYMAERERAKKEFRKTGKATPLAKIALRDDAMDAIWDLAEGRGRKKWGQF